MGTVLPWHLSTRSREADERANLGAEVRGGGVEVAADASRRRVV